MINRRVNGCCVAGLVTLTVLSGACSARQTTPPAGTAQPDRFLSERGTEALQMEEWVNARTYFQQIVDGYPQSPFRPDAKLGDGDAYLGEGTSESLVLAANRRSNSHSGSAAVRKQPPSATSALQPHRSRR